MEIVLPTNVYKILNTLRNNGYRGYIVGGSVRDSILGRQIHDWDITTNAVPEQVCRLFSSISWVTEIIPTGVKHGTVTLLINSETYEVTSFRQDGKYTDGRHPDSVEFVDDIVQDLARRDFTINAMAWSPWTGLVDPFGGQLDLQNECIVCVGNPHDRFTEDALRILRAWRFSCQLNFYIDIHTQNAMLALHETLSNVSKERIREEFCKAVMTSAFPYKSSFELPWIIPEYEETIYCEQNNPWHYLTVGDHTIEAMTHLSQSSDLITRLATLFHDIGKPRCKTTDENGIDHFYNHPETGAEMTDEIIKRLKFDNNTRTKVVELVRYHDVRFLPRLPTVKRWLNKLGEEQFRRWIQVRRADAKAQNLELSQVELDRLDEIEDIMETVLSENQAFTIKDLDINGYDLIAAGIEKGPEIGAILNSLLTAVIEDRVKNRKEELLDVIRYYLLQKENKE